MTGGWTLLYVVAFVLNSVLLSALVVAGLRLFEQWLSHDIRRQS